VKKDRFERWLQNIYNTRDEEISCSECFDLVSHYVDVELSGEDAARKMPQLKLHLNQCAACREEYETLRDLARLEKDEQPPSLDDLGDSLS
jgi:hypothetical protein